jgi:hypothetical protein
VKVFVDVTVMGFGVSVLVFPAVADGIVIVVNGPVVETKVDVVLTVVVIVGVVVTLNVTVGVNVDVTCGPASIEMS